MDVRREPAAPPAAPLPGIGVRYDGNVLVEARMAQTTFFAARSDEIDLLRFVFEATDCEVYEAHSRYDEELRRFESLAAVRDALDLGRDRPQKTQTVLLDLWSPSTRAEPTIRRIDLDIRDARFRYEISGWGLFRLELAGSRDGVVRESWFAHNSEQRARQRSGLYQHLVPPDEWDWDTVTRIGRRVIRHIRNRLSVAKVDSTVVLPQADALRHEGWKLGQ
jgi:hypothetical protein